MKTNDTTPLISHLAQKGDVRSHGNSGIEMLRGRRKHGVHRSLRKEEKFAQWVSNVNDETSVSVEELDVEVVPQITF